MKVEKIIERVTQAEELKKLENKLDAVKEERNRLRMEKVKLEKEQSEAHGLKWELERFKMENSNLRKSLKVIQSLIHDGSRREGFEMSSLTLHMEVGGRYMW